ncbi:UV-stimulated scaffold protein A isoform X2 [Leuresthes tenuis]|uniref:UV-stimulated scaffold protein A isoform X2 n=1 Tax=Leuresthes tenuis TaxID=355514 RepID=UPI003B500375
MELSRRERLSELVEELTTAGQLLLNQDKMKELKRICKVSNDCIDQVYHLVMSQLNQEHAEIRLSAFQIASELFSRSHHFRTVLVDNFQDFLELTVETNTELPLPPPKEVARKLRSLAIQTIQSWQASYGSMYKKLALGYHYLKQVKKVDFQDAEARTIAERRREEERQRKLERIYKARVEAAAKDMEESYQDIEATLTEMESCVKLLFPEFCLTDFQTSNSSCLNSQPVSECPSDDEEPCCSKRLTDSRREGERQEREGEKKSTVREKKRNNAEEERGKEDQEKRSEEQEHWKVKKDDDGEEDERKTGQGMGEQKNKHEEAEGSSEEEEEEPVAEDLFIRNSGLISHSYSLDLNLSPGLHVKAMEDNEPVVSMIVELHRLVITKHLPTVQGWVQVFTKSRAEQQLLRRALDLKKSLEAALQKHKELHIDYSTGVSKLMEATSDADEEDDNDFDEVPEKEGYELHIPEHLRAEYGLDPSPSTSTAQVTQKKPPKIFAAPLPPSTSCSSSKGLKRLTEEEQDPASAAATLRLLRQKISLPTESSSSTSGPSSSQSSSDLKTVEAPVVPFGLDLYYWGQEQPNAGKITKSASLHQFWVPTEVEEEVENQELLAESRSRYISFPGSFVPISHYCRAPLGNGSLCQRQDRFKCPFHGRIIPRDREGRPCRQEDRQREEHDERKRREQQPDWQDPELMLDIEAATGVDLGSDRLCGEKRKRKKKKYPNLSDLKQSSNTSRSRLERKVFNKSSVRRVAQVMSKADRRRHDKFSNQFNYALN